MAKHNRNSEALHKIAVRLKELRQQTEKSQIAVWRETGMNIGNIEAETTNITIATLDRLCDYYGVTLSEFFEEMEL